MYILPFFNFKYIGIIIRNIFEGISLFDLLKPLEF